MSDASKRNGSAPRVAMSTTSTLVNHTGSWKYIRPLYRDRVAPCNQGCPVGIDIEGYLNLLRVGRIEDACALLLIENPMPAVTGRVCDHPCERTCNRGEFDGAVAIHGVERTLGDRILGDLLPEPIPTTCDERVAIVGSGPAGLACAYHLARLGYAVTVFEAAVEAGGMLRLGIPEFRLPRTVLDRQIEWLRTLGVEIRCGVRVGRDVPWNEMADFHAVFVASGAHRGRDIGIAGEDLPGFRSGLDFLKEVNGGGRPEIGRHVVVVGGGNTAIDCARTALRLGADPVILYRRSRAEMPAIAQEVAEAQREGVRFSFLAAPVKVLRSGDKLESLECMRMELGPPDESGRRRPIPVDDDRFLLPADTVLKAIGETADLDFLPEDLGRGLSVIAVDQLGATSRVAVFAGGDITEQARTVAHALGAGKRAAIGIDRHFRQDQHGDEAGLADFRFAHGNLSMARWLSNDPVRRVAPVNDVVPFEELNVHHFDRVSRHDDRELSGLDSAAGFGEVNTGMTYHDSMDEARRCFNCGVCNECEICLILCPDVAIARASADVRFSIDMDYCKGCGICVTECPRGAMAMTREGP